MKGDEQFRLLGAHHAAQGLARYKFYDPHLQKLYNEGYDHGTHDVVFRTCEQCGADMVTATKSRYCRNCRF
jgi:hypothetical protein